VCHFESVSQKVFVKSAYSYSTCQRANTKTQLRPREVAVHCCRYFDDIFQNSPKILDVTRFTDETWFNSSGHVNPQNSRIWAAENPFAIRKELLHPEEVWAWSIISGQRNARPVFFQHAVGSPLCRKEGKFVCYCVRTQLEGELYNLPTFSLSLCSPLPVQWEEGFLLRTCVENEMVERAAEFKRNPGRHGAMRVVWMTKIHRRRRQMKLWTSQHVQDLDSMGLLKVNSSKML
jgi:hypothetical protein